MSQNVFPFMSGKLCSEHKGQAGVNREDSLEPGLLEEPCLHRWVSEVEGLVQTDLSEIPAVMFGGAKVGPLQQDDHLLKCGKAESRQSLAEVVRLKIQQLTEFCVAKCNKPSSGPNRSF